MKTENNFGTREWATKTVNCCTGCSHDCRYCYAKGMAVRFKQVTAAQWPHERIRPHDVDKIHKKYDGQIMFPSSHDITPTNLYACLAVLKMLLVTGNKVLVVSKPHLDCIRKVCDVLRPYRRRMLFRFSIGAASNKVLSYWEPNAPGYDERKEALIYAYNADFRTSVSVEPMLDSTHINDLISELLPYVTHSIWIGKMNHLGRFGKVSDTVFREAVDEIRRGQTDGIIRAIYDRHKDNPMIRWKKEIKKVVGIQVPKQNGLDI